MNDQEHKTFQKFNLYANELSSLNLSLNNDKDKIIKEGNDCLEYAQDNNMNLGKFKTFISEVYEPQEQLEQNPQLSKFSSIFKGHKDDDTDDIKEKIAEFKDHSIFMTKLFASISGGLVVLEVVLIVICLVWKNKSPTKEGYDNYKQQIDSLRNEITQLENAKKNFTNICWKI